MPTTICISANTFYYPKGGGHMWVYINWALGFKSLGCKVIWLEGVHKDLGIENFIYHLNELKGRLEPYGLAGNIAIWNMSGETLAIQEKLDFLDIDTAAFQTDLLINQYYAMPANILMKFKKTIFLDIDPGLTQIWISKGDLVVAPHDIYFTIGETVGQKHARFGNAGIQWHYTPPCVYLPEWPVVKSRRSAPFTTVSHWSSCEWVEYDGKFHLNSKKNGFLPFLQLPQQVDTPIELALCLGNDEGDEKQLLEKLKWRVVDSHGATNTPQKYKHYIQSSKGEFSCVKPSCVGLQNAWISDRTLCYLASGKPAVVQHTGPSKFLPDCAGLLRFKNFEEAIGCLNEVEKNYDYHCKLARALAEEYFDAKKVTKNLLERAL